MRKMLGAALAALLLASALFAARPVTANVGEDSFQECNYPRLTDLLVMRPLGTVALVSGTAMFGLMSPFTAAVAPREFPVVFQDLMAKPARFTFARRLGECSTGDLQF
jgi:hypothetical protein